MRVSGARTMPGVDGKQAAPSGGWASVTREQRRALVGISLSQLLLLSLWLSAAAVGPSLERQHPLPPQPRTPEPSDVSHPPL